MKLFSSGNNFSSSVNSSSDNCVASGGVNSFYNLYCFYNYCIRINGFAFFAVATRSKANNCQSGSKEKNLFHFFEI